MWQQRNGFVFADAVFGLTILAIMLSILAISDHQNQRIKASEQRRLWGWRLAKETLEQGSRHNQRNGIKVVQSSQHMEISFEDEIISKIMW